MDQIYTYMGDILIAVNPFQEIGVYGDKVRGKGMQGRGSEGTNRVEGMVGRGLMGGMREERYVRGQMGK